MAHRADPGGQGRCSPSAGSTRCSVPGRCAARCSARSRTSSPRRCCTARSVPARSCWSTSRAKASEAKFTFRGTPKRELPDAPPVETAGARAERRLRPDSPRARRPTGRPSRVRHAPGSVRASRRRPSAACRAGRGSVRRRARSAGAFASMQRRRDLHAQVGAPPRTLALRPRSEVPGADGRRTAPRPVSARRSEQQDRQGVAAHHRRSRPGGCRRKPAVRGDARPSTRCSRASGWTGEAAVADRASIVGGVAVAESSDGRAAATTPQQTIARK